jgi:hypothetical protein
LSVRREREEREEQRQEREREALTDGGETFTSDERKEIGKKEK